MTPLTGRIPIGKFNDGRGFGCSLCHPHDHKVHETTEWPVTGIPISGLSIPLELERNFLEAAVGPYKDWAYEQIREFILWEKDTVTGVSNLFRESVKEIQHGIITKNSPGGQKAVVGPDQPCLCWINRQKNIWHKKRAWLET